VGVGRVNLIQMSYYEFDNAYMLDMIAKYPDRFVGTGIVDPLAPAPDRAMRALKPKGVMAFRITTGYARQPAEKWLRPPGFDLMFDEAARSGQVMSCLIDPTCFAEVDRMATIHPKAPIIIDHFGRIGVTGEILPAEVKALAALAKHENVYVKIGAYYALGKKQPPYTDLIPMIRELLTAYGSNRLMWESDCPFQVVSHTYADSIDLIKKRLDFLTDDQRADLLTRTAEKLLFVKPA
jgi:predicted TIM-barrel fold metal-dependent hydrolase